MQWKESAEGAPAAMELQRANAAAFRDAFARGLAVTGFLRDPDGGGTFELGPWQEPPPANP
jgi:hypothetical protein